MAIRQTNSSAYYCRQSDVNKQGLAPILISISINGDRQYITTQFKAKPDEFKKSMASKRDNPIKSYVESLRQKLNSLQEEMMMANIELTAKSLKEYYMRGGVNKIYTLNDLFKEYQSIQHTRVNAPHDSITSDTYNRYVKTVEMFFDANPDLKPDMSAKTVTREHMLKYKAWLAERYEPTTSCNYLQKIKTYFLYAFECGKIPSFPFRGIHIDRGQKEGNIKYLTEEELDIIKNKKMPIDRLEKVKDIFLFACYTGLGFKDIVALNATDIQENKNGQLYINKQRIKTGIYYTTVLLQDANDIIVKYNYKLPVISNQKTNAYLKEIQEICGLNKNLTYYMARHTAATYLLNHHVPLETVSKILGHKSTRETTKYAKLLDETVFKDTLDLSDAYEEIVHVISSDPQLPITIKSKRKKSRR